MQTSVVCRPSLRDLQADMLAAWSLRLPSNARAPESACAPGNVSLERVAGRLADDLLTNAYRWISSPAAALHSPALKVRAPSVLLAIGRLVGFDCHHNNQSKTSVFVYAQQSIARCNPLI